MSSALGRACSGAARRLAASQGLGGAWAGARGASSFPADRPRGSGGEGSATDGEQWKRLRDAGEKINPCNSPLHPAVKAGTLPPPSAESRLSVQAAYDPRGMCFGCGASRARGVSVGRSTQTLRVACAAPHARHAAAHVLRTCAPGRPAHVVVSHGVGAADRGDGARQVSGAPHAAVAKAAEADVRCRSCAPPRRSFPGSSRPASCAR